jgi:hypothetical protein
MELSDRDAARLRSRGQPRHRRSAGDPAGLATELGGRHPGGLGVDAVRTGRRHTLTITSHTARRRPAGALT